MLRFVSCMTPTRAIIVIVALLASTLVAVADYRASERWFNQKTDAARDIVKTEVWTSMDWTGNFHESGAAMVSFFQVPPGGWDTYTRLESSFWKPLHEKAIEAGAEDGWWMLGLMFPSGAHYGYNAATMNFVSSLSEAMNIPGPSAYLGDVHPNLEWSDMSHMTLKARKDARFELWTFVDHVHGEE